MLDTFKYDYDEEYDKFIEYKKTHDKKIRDELYKKYSYIAKILSKKYTNCGADIEDIYQVASMGIIYAIERFDPERGVNFAFFATPTVLGEIRKYFRDKGRFIRIPRSLYNIFYKAEKLKKSSDKESYTLNELSNALNIPEKDITEAYAAGDKAFIRSLEYEAFADGSMNLSYFLGKEDSNFLIIEDNEFISSSLKRLGDKEREFINLRYFKELTQSEISKIWNVSQMQISRYEKKLLDKLRNFYFQE